jgi:NitT/TauT family transport system substrate-binding protein
MKKKFLKKIMAVVMVSALSLSVLAGCGNVAEETTEEVNVEEAVEEVVEEAEVEEVAEMVDVTIYGVVDPQVSAQQIIAKEMGYFEEFGVNVTNHLLEGSSDMASLIASGEAQVSCESNYTDISLASNGINIKMLFPVADIGGTQCVVAREGLEITGPEDLEGLTIGMASGAGILIAISAMCDELGVDFDSLEFVTLDPSDQVAAMENGSIDLMACWQPWVNTAVENGGTLLFSGLDSYIPGAEGPVSWLNFHTTFQVTEEFYNENYDVCVAMSKAMAKATDYINEDMEGAAEIISEQINVDADQVLAIMKMNTYSVEFNQQFVDATNVMAQFMFDMGNIEEVPAFDTFGEPDALRDAVPELVTVD